MEAVETHSQNELIAMSSSACGCYEVLIAAGGDGTFHHVVNAVAGKENAPILGYINVGTMGDVGRLFGVKRNLKRSLKIIESGVWDRFDLGKVNHAYFVYMAAAGAYSDVSYLAKRKAKAIFGRLVYYRLSLQEAFRKKRVTGLASFDGAQSSFDAPFVLLMNGPNVGGFSVNPKSSPQDGQLEAFLTPPGRFNGLIHYLSRNRRFEFCVKSGSFSLKKACTWCLDGEKYDLPKEVEIGVSPSAIRVFCHKK